MTFDREGRLTSYRDGEHEYRPDATAAFLLTKNADGTSTRTDSLSGMNAWGMESLRGLTFGTLGASVGRTVIDSRGAPVRTRLQAANGDTSGTIIYICDEEGRVIEALLHPETPAFASLSKEIGADRQIPSAIRDMAIARHVLRYDEDGRLIVSESYMGGQRVRWTERTYNSSGDVQTSTDAEGTTRFEYRYDQRGNWIHKKTIHPHVSYEERREIDYYD